MSARIDPLVPGAKFAVRCTCGYGVDSAKDTPEQAIEEIAASHQCAEPAWTTVAY